MKSNQGAIQIEVGASNRKVNSLNGLTASEASSMGNAHVIHEQTIRRIGVQVEDGRII